MSSKKKARSYKPRPFPFKEVAVRYGELCFLEKDTAALNLDSQNYFLIPQMIPENTPIIPIEQCNAHRLMKLIRCLTVLGVVLVDRRTRVRR